MVSCCAALLVLSCACLFQSVRSAGSFGLAGVRLAGSGLLEQRKWISLFQASRSAFWLASAEAAMGNPNGPNKRPVAKPMATREPTLSSYSSAFKRISAHSFELYFLSAWSNWPVNCCGLLAQPATKTPSPAHRKNFGKNMSSPSNDSLPKL